jgi:hypothetical protein
VAATAEALFREAWAIGRSPRSTLLSTIASVFPGNSVEMQMICKRVASIIPQDTLPVSRFNNLYLEAVQEVREAEGDVRVKDSKGFSSFSSSSTATSSSTASSSSSCRDEEKARVSGLEDKDNETSSVDHLTPIALSFVNCEEFIRYVNSHDDDDDHDDNKPGCNRDSGDGDGVNNLPVVFHMSMPLKMNLIFEKFVIFAL